MRLAGLFIAGMGYYLLVVKEGQYSVVELQHMVAIMFIATGAVISIFGKED